MSDDKNPRWYENFTKIESPQKGKNHLVGVVVAFKSEHESERIILAVDGGEGTRLVLSIKSIEIAQNFSNLIVVVNFEKNALIVAKTLGSTAILQLDVNPEKVGLPHGWASS